MKFNTFTATCLLMCSTSTFAATNQSSRIINRIDRAQNATQQFLQDRFSIDTTLRVRADNHKVSGEHARTDSHVNADIWLSAKLYRDWTAKLELEPQFNLRTGKMNGAHDVPMNKFYVEGTLLNHKVRVGKFGAFSSYGRVFDNEVTGAELSFDHVLVPTKLTVARVTKLGFNDNGFHISATDKYPVGVHRKGTVILQSRYPLAVNTNVGGTVAYVQDVTRQNGSKKDAWFGEVGVDTKFNTDWSGYIAYSRSNIDDTFDANGKKVAQDGAFAEVKYKNADWNTPQSYDIYANIRRVGAMSGISSVNDYSKNVQGVQVGGDYVPYKNLKLGAFYLQGKDVNPIHVGSKETVRVLRAQAEYKF